jgi:hypothetical protein
MSVKTHHNLKHKVVFEGVGLISSTFKFFILLFWQNLGDIWLEVPLYAFDGFLITFLFSAFPHFSAQDILKQNPITLARLSVSKLPFSKVTFLMICKSCHCLSSRSSGPLSLMSSSRSFLHGQRVLRNVDGNSFGNFASKSERTISKLVLGLYHLKKLVKTNYKRDRIAREKLLKFELIS